MACRSCSARRSSDVFGWPRLIPSRQLTCLRLQNTEGWTTRAIHAAAKDLNFSPALSGVCKSEADLVEYFIRQCNNALFDKIADERPLWASRSPTDRLKLAVRWRLEMLEPYIGMSPHLLDMDGTWRLTSIVCGSCTFGPSLCVGKLALLAICAMQLNLCAGLQGRGRKPWRCLQRRRMRLPPYR